MTTPSAGRDPFLPVAPKDRGVALGLALLAHGLLIAALTYGVHWRNTPPTPMAAELWTAVPQAAAPRAVEPAPVPAPLAAPTPTPPDIQPPAPVPTPTPTPAPRPVPALPRPAAPPLPDAQIAIEQARKRAAAKREQDAEEARETAKRAAIESKRIVEKARVKEAEKAAEAAAVAARKVEQAKAEQAKAEKVAAERKKALQAQAAASQAAALQAAKAQAQAAQAAQAAREAKADEARLATARDANLKRIAGLAGATGGATDTGSALRSGAPSASYAGRIMARIKPNIVFSDAVDGNPLATVEVKLAPDGTITAKRLVKSSGLRAWDEAVLRAIERTEVLPRDIDGRVPGPFQIDFKFRE